MMLHGEYRILMASLLLLTITGASLKIKISEDISDRLLWSERMALSVMKRNPDPWLIDCKEQPKWEYTQGLVLKSIEKVGEKVGNEKYGDYIKAFADFYISPQGDILTYTSSDFNIDRIAPGRVLYKLYQKTREEKYLKAIHKLHYQLTWQPRTKEGGFWHKLRYPWQMWLDGLYMGSPFYAEYALVFNQQKAFDDICTQTILMEKNMRDSATGLFYHGWDECRLQRWAHPERGTSPNFWGRAMGWYGMALVDILDFLPPNHPQRARLVEILQQYVSTIEKYQHPSGAWYQVMDKADAPGNYLESSATCMFAYTIAKSVNKGYVSMSKMEIARKAFDGIIRNFIKVGEDGEVHIDQACEVAGLGGEPYRDGSYQYYVNEKVRRNDPKAEGPFIMACLELNR